MGRIDPICMTVVGTANRKTAKCGEFAHTVYLQYIIHIQCMWVQHRVKGNIYILGGRLVKLITAFVGRG